MLTTRDERETVLHRSRSAKHPPLPPDTTSSLEGKQEWKLIESLSGRLRQRHGSCALNRKQFPRATNKHDLSTEVSHPLQKHVSKRQSDNATTTQKWNQVPDRAAGALGAEMVVQRRGQLGLHGERLVQKFLEEVLLGLVHQDAGHGVVVELGPPGSAYHLTRRGQKAESVLAFIRGYHGYEQDGMAFVVTCVFSRRKSRRLLQDMRRVYCVQGLSQNMP